MPTQSAKQLVKQKHPGAFPERCNSRHPVWKVWAHTSYRIGTGNTEIQAWNDALRYIKLTGESNE